MKYPYLLAAFASEFWAMEETKLLAIVDLLATPGGNVLGVDEASAAVAAVRGRKPIVVQVSGYLASAGYWIGASADEIVLSPSSAVGAIGVRMAYDDLTAKLAKDGIVREIIAAGKYKGEGLLGPLSDETRAYMQGRADDYYAMFVDRVATGRGVTAANVRDGFGQGRMLGAQAAVREKMADRVATMRETLDRFGAGGPAPRRLAPERERRALALR